MKKMLVRQILARNLGAAMQRKPGLDTQKALAKKAKMGQSHVSRILNCTTSPTIDTLANLGEVLDVHPWELLTDSNAVREDALRRILQGGAAEAGEQDPATLPSKVVPIRRRHKGR